MDFEKKILEKHHEKHKSRWGLDKRGNMVLLSFFIAAVSSYFIGAGHLTQSQTYVQFILVMSVSLWLTEAVPPYSVGIMIIFLSVVLLPSGVDGGYEIDNKQFYLLWASPTIFLMLGGFFLAEALHATNLDRKLFNYALSIYGLKPKYIILGLMLTTAVLSMMMSNTATTAMMIASVSPFIAKFGEKEPFTKAVLLGIPTAASVGGMGTIIGTPPNAIALAELELHGSTVNFVEWMMYGVPVAIVLIVIFWYILIKRYPTNITEITIDIEEASYKNETGEMKQKQRITVVTLVITMLLWLTTPLHHIHVAIIAAIPILSYTFLGVLSSADVKRLSWDTLMLVAGGLALGEAIKQTGLAEYYINLFQLDQLNKFLILAAFGFLTVIFSNIMSNTATTSLMVPVGFLLLPNDLLLVALVTSLSASCAVLLPVSTPPNAIAFSTGLLKQSDFRLGGFFLGIFGPIFILLYLLLIV